ncbi:MAG: DUF4376 domain-containing protein [Helicobacteraceae bacterium]|jgi:hypothetical protein|nr:DUF4376 domain-containing protein [Helicobacteraceae bacterium]
MKWFRDLSGSEFGVDENYAIANANEIEAQGWVEITREEAAANVKAAPLTKADKIAAINAERDAELAALIVEYNGARYDADEKSQLRMTAALSLLSVAGDGASQEWIDADNIARSLSANDFAQIGALIARKVTAIMLAARAKKDAVNAEIEGIDSATEARNDKEGANND